VRGWILFYLDGDEVIDYETGVKDSLRRCGCCSKVLYHDEDWLQFSDFVKSDPCRVDEAVLSAMSVLYRLEGGER